MGISYPDDSDIQHAKHLGKNPGDEINIHGIRNGLGFIGKFHRFADWTAGCIAIKNSEIEELYTNVPIDTEISIRK